MQHFEFSTSTTDGPAEVSENATNADIPKEEAAAKPQAEVDSDADNESLQPKEEVLILQPTVPQQWRMKTPKKNLRNPRKGHIPSPGKSTL